MNVDFTVQLFEAALGQFRDIEKVLERVAMSLETIADRPKHDDARIEAILRLFQSDPHHYSPRPCQTCTAITAVAGRPFGCLLVHR